MTYFAYVRTDDTLRLDYAGRDEDRGIIGTVYDLPEAIAECDTLDAAVAAGYAYIGHHPSASVYVADANALLHKMLLCHPHHKQVSGLQKSLFVAWTCFAFAALSLVATVLFGLGTAGLALATFSIGLYLLMIRIGFMNEVESAMISLIFSTLLFFLVPAIRAAWAAYQLRNG